MSLPVLLLIVSISGRAAIAASVDVPTTVGWMPDPNGRGTFSLVLSCVLTLGLCVWSAMHLNIPPHRSSHLHIWIRSFMWGVTGVFAPELVVFAAWRQYNSAKELNSRVNPGIGNVSTKIPELVHPWTMVHSFYAGMGGFSFELDPSFDSDNPQFIPGDQRLTLSARGIALLAQCGHLPNIPAEDIIDKSKADGLAKSLVCLQAAWMVVQVIGRLALGLPITLLEVNILGHVFCALVIYILWWHKPRLVNEPTALRGEWVKPLCAYMFMCSQISGSERNLAGALWQAWLKPEVANTALFVPKQAAKTEKLELDSSVPSLQKVLTQQSQSSLEVPPVEVTKIPSIKQSVHIGLRPLDTPAVSESYKLSDSAERAMEPTAIELERWRLAAEAISTYPILAARFKERHELPTSDWLEFTAEEFLTRGATNWPAEDLLRGTEGLIMGMTLWCASMAYGAVHIAAWNDYFPTAVEQWLWRSSAVYISFSGALWLLINLMAHEWKALDAYWDRVLRREAHWSSYVVLGTLCTICGIAYVAARLFLVVEAFLSIRELPIAAYDTPDWTKFLPHF